ncbi:MAG: imidazole glycerol phosphate synthase subunit HisH [Cellvibrionaceae bacterium]
MSASSVAIIDYGMGNLHSVASALAHVSPESNIQITADPQAIRNADKVIFPGVGAIRDCMAEIHRLGFDTLVPQVVNDGKPVLAICVGMQSLLQQSEENNGVEGMHLFPGQVKFFGNDLCDEQNHRLKVPHMGWNQVEQTNDHPLWHNIENNSRFYFVHSYYAELVDSNYLAGKSHYGKDFTAAIAHNNIFATQFHPEKSHTAGLQLLKNFTEWNGA